MAQIVLGVAGAAIGSAFGPTGAQWGWAAGSLLGSLIGGGKTNRQSQALIDLKIVGTDYGQPIPYGRGTIPCAGQVWWNSDRQPVENTTTTRQGKGGGEKTETTTVTYKVDVLFGLTDIQIAGITRIWDTGSGKLIYHVADDAPVGAMIASGETSEWDRMTVYTGAADQTPDPTYVAAVTNAPAYRHRGSVFIQGLNLGQSGQMRNLLFEVVIDGASTGIVEREWGGMGSGVLSSSCQEIAYDQDRSELWTNYAQGSNGVGTTGKVSVYDLIDETWTFIDPPATYAINENTNASLHARIAYGKFYTQVLGGPGGTHRTTAIYDVASKTFDTLLSDLLPEHSGNIMVSAIDETNNLMLIEEGGHIFSLWSTSDGTPSIQLFDTVTSINPGWVSTATNDGIFYLLSDTNTVYKISVDGISSFTPSPAPSPGHMSGKWTYDTVRNCIYFFSDSDIYEYLYRLDCDDDTISAVNATPFNISSASNDNYWVSAIVGYDAITDRIILKRGFGFGTGGQSRVGYMNPDSGEIEQALLVSTIDTDWGGGNVPAYGGVVWGLGQDTDYSPDLAGMVEVRFGGMADDPPTVQEVVEGLCARAGMTSGQYDATELSSITRLVKCMPVAAISSAASVIDLLAGNYFFDTVCDDKIRFFPRGSSPVATLAFEDLGAAEPGAEAQDALPLTERSDIEIPAQLALSFANLLKDYETDTQYSDRLTSTLDNSVESVEIQLGLEPEEGKLVADASLLDQAASRWAAPVSLLGHYARVQPGDVVTVTMQDDSTLRMRSTRMRDAFPIMYHELVLDEPSALESLGITSVDYTSSTDVTGPVDSAMRILDIPILRSADDDAGFYVAAKPSSGTTFPGAAIFDSEDDATFTRQATVLETAVFGTTTTALTSWLGPRVVDEVSTVTVNVGEGTLSSSTRDLVLASASVNAALIGDEIVQFITATLVSAGVYTLSRFLRGSRGTEWAMTGHSASERFVLLREAGIRRLSLESAQLGVERYYKAVTLGRAVSSATSQEFTAEGIGKKPFAPVDLRASRDSSNNITFTCRRRSRLFVRMVGTMGILVPLGEDVEAYEWDVYDDESDANVLRTLTSSTPTVQYTAAQQTSDGLTPGDPVAVGVFQMSADVGRGYELRDTV